MPPIGALALYSVHDDPLMGIVVVVPMLVSGLPVTASQVLRNNFNSAAAVVFAQSSYFTVPADTQRLADGHPVP